MTTIYEAMAAVMHDVQAVKKGDRNAAQGFMFRGIDATLNAVGPALRTHRVVVSPRVDSIEYTTVEVGSKRTPMGHVRVLVTYTFYGPEGDSLPAQAPGEAFDSGDKATPKAMSVAYRTALLQALALPTDEPDPDSETYERSEAALPPALDEVLAAVQRATSEPELNRVVNAAKGHLSPEDLATVRDVYLARKAELAEAA